MCSRRGQTGQPQALSTWLAGQAGKARHPSPQAAPPGCSAAAQLASTCAGAGICCRPNTDSTPVRGPSSSSRLASPTLRVGRAGGGGPALAVAWRGRAACMSAADSAAQRGQRRQPGARNAFRRATHGAGERGMSCAEGAHRTSTRPASPRSATSRRATSTMPSARSTPTMRCRGKAAASSGSSWPAGHAPAGRDAGSSNQSVYRTRGQPCVWPGCAHQGWPRLKVGRQSCRLGDEPLETMRLWRGRVAATRTRPAGRHRNRAAVVGWQRRLQLGDRVALPRRKAAGEGLVVALCHHGPAARQQLQPVLGRGHGPAGKSGNGGTVVVEGGSRVWPSRSLTATDGTFLWPTLRKCQDGSVQQT